MKVTVDGSAVGQIETLMGAAATERWSAHMWADDRDEIVKSSEIAAALAQLHGAAVMGRQWLSRVTIEDFPDTRAELLVDWLRVREISPGRLFRSEGINVRW